MVDEFGAGIDINILDNNNKSQKPKRNENDSGDIKVKKKR